MSSNMEYLEQFMKNLAEMDDLRDLKLVAGLDGER